MMALVGIDDTTVEKVCVEQRELGKKVWPANYNMDGQLVLAGIKSDLESLVDVFKGAGAKRAIVLDMSVASHCELLKSAVENLKPYLQEFLKDEFAPVISNVSTQAYTTKDEAIELLASQLTSPVKYKQSIKAHEDKVDLFIEFGNGIVLKGLNKKITDKPTVNVSDMKTLEAVIGELND
jgi:[acyl-carrier-protein] S-malonyltransferase